MILLLRPKREQLFNQLLDSHSPEALAAMARPLVLGSFATAVAARGEPLDPDRHPEEFAVWKRRTIPQSPMPNAAIGWALATAARIAEAPFAIKASALNESISRTRSESGGRRLLGRASLRHQISGTLKEARSGLGYELYDDGRVLVNGVFGPQLPSESILECWETLALDGIAPPPDGRQVLILREPAGPAQVRALATYIRGLERSATSP